MSEETNLETINLCITEDAFEQFQADSVYEENEYITLADIIPTESSVPHNTNEIDEIPYDNEVVLSSNMEQLDETNSKSGPCIEEIPIEIEFPPVNVSQKNLSVQPPVEEADEETFVEKPKRGIKTNSFTGTNISSDIQIFPSQEHIQANENSSIDSTPKPYRKRGRKPKNYNVSELLTDIPNNETVSLNSSTDSQNSVQKKTGRRGRPRRVTNNSTNILEQQSNGDNGLLSEIGNHDINRTEDSFVSTLPKKTPGRRGRPRKRPIEETVTGIEQQPIENTLTTDNVTHTNNEFTVLNEHRKGPGRPSRQRKNIEDNYAAPVLETDVTSVSGFEDNKNLSEDKLPKKSRGRKKKTVHEELCITQGNQEVTVESEPSVSEFTSEINVVEDDDDGDDMCLSRLKETMVTSSTDSAMNNEDSNVVVEDMELEEVVIPYCDVETEPTNDKVEESPSKRNSKPPIMPDFEYDMDHIVNETVNRELQIEQEISGNDLPDNSLLVEDTSKRPVRRKVKQTLHYDEASDEDPFANVELSDDDEPRKARKGKRYYSDDEYVPGGKRGRNSSLDVSDSDIDEILEGAAKQKRKRGRNSGSQAKSPRKKKVTEEMSKNAVDITTIPPINDAQQDDDFEVCLQSSVIKINDEPNQKSSWDTTKEFENFIAKKIHGSELKIKKVAAGGPPQSAPLEIPVIDPNEIMKKIEMFTQTCTIQTTTVGVQTASPFEIPMKKNVSLTNKQSENACEFLKSVVKTTSELGNLMTQKSDDFIAKKINTEHVTDTFKMDYCVRKSFLLFKLAKHNLVQMEEDLTKQYEEFLISNDLLSCREQPKKIVAKEKVADSDSDCEIVEETIPASKADVKPKFNPKTVFLNKELSIKIAKKSTAPETKKCKEKLNIKGRHTVWISDSVMVKKVKPTQSFLAQDSRNKKPPDCYITEKMVSEFFKEYYQKRAQFICAPYTSSEWLATNRNYVCNYFVKTDQFTECRAGISNNGGHCLNNTENSDNMSHLNNSSDKSMIITNKMSSPKSLSALCIKILEKQLQLFTTKDNCHSISDTIADVNNEDTPETLIRLCVNILTGSSLENNSSLNNHKHKLAVILPLKKMCYDKIMDLFFTFNAFENESLLNSAKNGHDEPVVKIYNTHVIDPLEDVTEYHNRKEIADDLDSEKINFVTTQHIKSLFCLCVDLIQTQQKLESKLEPTCENLFTQKFMQEPDSLKHITFDNVKFHLYKSLYFNKVIYESNIKNSARAKVTTIYKVKSLADICFEMVTKLTDNDNIEDYVVNTTAEDLTINCVNTMSQEVFQSIEDTGLNTEENSQNLEDEDFYNDEFDTGLNYEIDNQTENSWVAQVQMKELRSCFVPNGPKISGLQTKVNEEVIPHFAQIKIEPLEESGNVVDSSIVKIEPAPNLDEMTVIPDPILTKQENTEYPSSDAIVRQDSSSYDIESFEAFVRSNKMMHAIGEDINDEIFSQSALRVRRQYEPDSDNENYENDTAMNLLIPQTFEPLHIENVKDSLMASSSDDNSSKKITGKKKTDKRGRRKPKNNTKQTKDAVATKEKVVSLPSPAPKLNEVAKLTKRMRDKIRQEEKKIESSDSETDTIPLNLRKDKNRKDCVDKSISVSSTIPDDEIQCNNVDSTEQIEKVDEEKDNNFSGFSVVDQNEISSYHKYVQYVYDKILPKVSGESANSETSLPSIVDDSNTDTHNNYRSSPPLINPNEPVEMLECEPTMPEFYKEEPKVKNVTTKAKSKKKLQATGKELLVTKNKFNYTEHNGWHCYPVDGRDAKLCLNAAIILEKLPESFVETYFRYQNITDTKHEDAEVDKLINLQSLNRSMAKDGKIKSKSKSKLLTNEQSQGGISDGSRAATPVNSDRCDELTASEDEHNVKDEIPPPVMRQTENNLAKNLLMDEKESDSESPIKKIKDEPKELQDSTKKKLKISPKKAPEAASEHPDSLMLTADKMMNKELNLLHAPIVLNDEIPGTSAKGLSTRSRHKNKSKEQSTKDRIKNDDDSSSEEEKQWVNTKEKLLKRLGKKQNTASVDDAKRAKLVSEFIERRGDIGEPRKRGRGSGVRRRSRKKRLEREKQLRVLSKELFGESPTDARYPAKQFSQSFFKGRRNIRKVIDKKSLARSTVIANMEEFERKCRLNQRQNRLRELLGYEESVNVLVINGEVCLEYDFQKMRSVVSVHPFFTKVMKAHQYEGVKFMWDACFETLDKVQAGHGGGGCILAHCMGLGKTLQVLALLHTVLTHPRVGMRRVLVCCPLSTVLNWVDEIHKWIGPVTDQIKVFELSKLKKTYERAYQLEDWFNGGGIFIIGYELFRSLSTLDPLLDDVRPTIINKIRTALLDPGPDIVVCDEGHLLKNDCSVLAVAMSRVVTKRRIVLTGTPMQNNLREYYCMVNFIKPNLLGTYPEYSNRFENPIMNGQHRDSQEEDIKLMKQRTHILHKVLEGCLQRQEASVLYPYLPKKHEYTVFISLTKCQWDLYKHYMSVYAKQSKQSILKDFHILQKIWSHPQVLHNFQMRSRDEAGNKIKPEKLEDDLAHEDLAASEDIKPADTEVWWLQYLEEGKMLDCLESSNKFVAVFRILDESISLGDKVLIFSTSLITMDALEFFLKKINKWSLGQEYYRLDGSVPPEVRQKWCREFNAENNHKTKLFLISTRAGSLGLNMVAANRVIILDTSWNPAHDIQSIFRVYRFGQKKDCYIYRLVALGTMEQKIYERSVTKQAVSCRVVDEQQIDRHYNMAELTELYRYDEGGVGVPGGVAVGITDVALLRVARSAALHAVHEHDSLLRGSSEQSLPEHERAAAWMQFQEEHAHKQMQNQLIPSFTLQIPTKRPHTFDQPTTSKEQPALANVEHPEDNTRLLKQYEPRPKKGRKQSVEVKIEDSANDTEYLPTKAGPKSKTYKKSPRASVNTEEPAPTVQETALDDAIVKKIMAILIRHNVVERQKQSEINALIANVRKIVAHGKVPTHCFNKELTETIANILLGKELNIPVHTDAEPESQERTRRSKRNKQTVETPSACKPIERPTDKNVKRDGRKRRKAAVVAEKQSIDSIQTDSVPQLDNDWQANAGSETDSAPERRQYIASSEEIKEKKREIPNKVTRKPEQTQSPALPQKEVIKPNVQENTILLSDEDESLRASKQTIPAVSNTKSDKTKGITLPLSLLTNENFIRIVAHTYMEGNSMDADAADLAAKYSTNKALKNYESTKKPIDSGPIFDIAVKVLGADLIKTLNEETRAVPTAPKTPDPPGPLIKLEPREIRPRVQLLTKTMKPVVVKPETLQPAVRNGGFGVQPAPPAVVPVGLIQNSVSIASNQPFAARVREESILPDDDEISVISDLPASNSLPTFSPQIPQRSPVTPIILTKQSFLPKIQISGGKVLIPQSTAIATTPISNVVNVQAIPKPVLTTSMGGTICLDSDEEESITPNILPTPLTPVKRVALKSTAKKQGMAVPLTTANPGLGQPQPINLNAQFISTDPGQSNPVLLNAEFLNHTHTAISVQNLPPKANYVVIPASQISKLTKLSKGMVSNTLQPKTSQPNIEKSQTMNLINSPNVNHLNQISPTPISLFNAQAPYNAMNSQAPYNMVNVHNMLNAQNPLGLINAQTPLSYINLMNSAPQGMNLINSAPQMCPTTVESILPTQSGLIRPVRPVALTKATANIIGKPGAPVTPSKATSKTVCKPGDILRITATGAVEILNRSEEITINENSAKVTERTHLNPLDPVVIPDDTPLPLSAQKSTLQCANKSERISDNTPRPSKPPSSKKSERISDEAPQPLSAEKSKPPSTRKSERISGYAPRPLSAQKSKPERISDDAPRPLSARKSKPSSTKLPERISDDAPRPLSAQKSKPSSTKKPERIPDDTLSAQKFEPSSTRKTERIRKISSSSSSSESSRPSTPDDPLSILKDVVHIRAADDPEPSCSQKNTKALKPSKDQNVSNTKDTSLLSTASNNSKNSTTHRLGNSTHRLGNSITITAVKDKKSNSAPSSSSVDKRHKQTKTTAKIVESVDLTDFDLPSISVKKPQNSVWDKDVVIIGDTTDDTPASQPQTRLSKKKELPSKIIGTSKNIIISGSGKATTAWAESVAKSTHYSGSGKATTSRVDDASSSSKKTIKVTNVEKIAMPASAPMSWSDVKKRAAGFADSSASKKKKTEPMTLKDFDIDDIDDIIELE